MTLKVTQHNNNMFQCLVQVAVLAPLTLLLLLEPRCAHFVIEHFN